MAAKNLARMALGAAVTATMYYLKSPKDRAQAEAAGREKAES
jgi:hypothetical protein